MTAQSCHDFFCATTVVWERSLGSTSVFQPILAHSLHPIQTRSVLTRDRAHLLHGSRPIAPRQFALLFSAISRFVKAAGLIAVAAAIRDSECEHFKTASRHSCLHRTLSSSHAVAQSHEHSEIGQSAKNSKIQLLYFAALNTK